MSYGATPTMSYGATPTTTGDRGKPSAGVQQDIARICSLGDLPALVMPWFLFALTMVPMALLTDALLGIIALATSLVLSLWFVCLSKGRAWLFLAVVCFALTLLGAALGSYDHNKYMSEFAIYEKSPSYDNILPSEDPGAFKDGAFLGFSKDSHVDTTRGLGYMDGKLWCVAPIVDGPADVVGFWAVGTNCCRDRGFFACGDMSNASLHSGLVVLDTPHISSPDIDGYKAAAKMASETYALGLADEPTFIQWGVSPSQALQSKLGSAIIFVVFALLASLLVIPSLVVVLNLTDLSLMKRESDMVKEMTFGFDWTPRTYSRQIELDLLNHRCYWSGEVIYDYAFHLANKHLFIGPLFCHPVHPLAKWERWIVVAITICLLIFPVAAFSAAFGQDSLTRSIIVLVFATAPRNLLKLYLMDVSQADSVLELEGGDGARNRAKIRQAETKEYILLTVAAVLTVAICVFCVGFVKSHTADPLAQVLRRNCDGIGFAFVLEIAFDLLIPFWGDAEYAHQVTLGFFGRWRWERDDYAGDKVWQQSKIEPQQQQGTPMKQLTPLSLGSAGALLGQQPQQVPLQPMR